MIQRYDLVTASDGAMRRDDGDYVLYTDHLAAMSELKDQGQAIVDRYEERLKEKDKEIARLRNSHEMKFVRHIEAHLSAYQVPICKICGKDIFEISEEDSDETHVFNRLPF